MAYAAVISLADTTHRFLNHKQLSISLEEKQHILSLLEYATLFQSFLDKFPDKFSSLEGRMREVANEAEDIFEYLMLEKVSPSSDIPSGKHELQLKKVMDMIDLIAKEVMEINESSSSSSSSKDVGRGGADSSAALSSSSTAPPIRKDAMVGFQDYVLEIKDRLCGEPSKLQVIPICGMGGIGKTTLAKNIYDDPLIMGHFVIRVWVTISQDFSAQRILSSILESLKEYNKGVKGQSNDEKVHKILMGRRYLVVMDDMWSGEAWDVVRRVFPDDGNASRVMLTTRLYDVASYPDHSSKLHEMSLLSADQSWDLFKQKVFADEDCPSELENIGKEIAASCRGLPLAIVVIAGLLSTAGKNPASWLEITEKVKSAETAEHDQIEEILHLSYVQLPTYLRPCFLYMGSFPEDHEISVSRLIRLWVAEGFVKSPIDSKSFEKVAEECLEELVMRNLVLVTKRKFDGRIRWCSLHDLMRDLCIRKAHEFKFFLNVMDMYINEEHFIQSVKDQRRVSVHSSCIHYLSSCDGSTIHSIKFSGHRLENFLIVYGDGLTNLDFVEGVRLARVLDAEAVNVESLPSQLYELFHLRYFAVRYSSGIPRALLCLRNLQTLIIRESDTAYVLATGMLLPWGMLQIRHVYYFGEIYFEDPRETTCSLENLQTLSRVDSACCTEQILKKIPNLKKLKMDCPSDGDAACLNDLVHLNQLENFEVCGSNRYWPHRQPKYYKYSFPETLKKLTLTYLELPRSDITVVGSLPNLQVLKLKDCTGEGGTWETTEGAFPVLEVLVIECSRLESWETERSHFPRLKRLLLHSCEDLSGITNDIGEIPTLQLIEVNGRARKSLIESVELIREEQEDMGNNTLHVVCTAKSLPIDSDDDEDDDSDDVPSLWLADFTRANVCS